MNKTGLFFLLLPFSIFGQDLTGKWIGTGGSGAHYLELVILQTGDSCFGYTYDEGPGFCKANFVGKFEKEKQKLKGKGTSFIEKSFGHSLAVYHLNYSVHEGQEYLNGTLGPRSAGALMLSLGIPSFAQLKKITALVDTTRLMSEKANTFKKRNKFTDTVQAIAQKQVTPVIEQKDTGRAINEAKGSAITITKKQERLSKMVETIYTNADTIQLNIYDNGVVDDDTVTVFLDNTVILDRYRITEKAKELYIPVTKNGQPQVLELFANNLGTIPPNTALIIITAGKARYEVHASYDLSTNAKIIFQFKE